MKTLATVAIGFCIAFTSAAAWSQDAAEPVRCNGNETISLKGVRIDGGEKPAVIAEGYCTVIIKQSELEGPVAVQISDGARVELREVNVVGKPTSIHLKDKSTLVVDRLEFVGDVLVEGQSEIEYEGSLRRFDADHSKAGVKDASKLKKGEPMKCIGSKKLLIQDTTITTDEDGVFVQGRCDVKIINSRIISKDDALVVQGKANVEIIDSEIVGADTALRLVGGATVLLKGTRVKGRVKRVGGARITGAGGNLFVP